MKFCNIPKNIFHFAVISGDGSDGYAPLQLATPPARGSADEDYVVLYEYTAQVITVNVI